MGKKAAGKSSVAADGSPPVESKSGKRPDDSASRLYRIPASFSAVKIWKYEFEFDTLKANARPAINIIKIAALRS